jgi:hypothetical protein
MHGHRRLQRRDHGRSPQAFELWPCHRCCFSVVGAPWQARARVALLTAQPRRHHRSSWVAVWIDSLRNRWRERCGEERTHGGLDSSSLEWRGVGHHFRRAAALGPAGVWWLTAPVQAVEALSARGRRRLPRGIGPVVWPRPSRGTEGGDVDRSRRRVWPHCFGSPDDRGGQAEARQPGARASKSSERAGDHPTRGSRSRSAIAISRPGNRRHEGEAPERRGVTTNAISGLDRTSNACRPRFVAAASEQYPPWLAAGMDASDRCSSQSRRLS